MKKDLNILIVEDQLGFAEGMEMVLQQHPRVNNTFIVSTFDKTLEILKENAVEIAILDIHLETNQYDGFTIAKKIKQLYPEIKIMILTQIVKKEYYDRLFNECKVDAYLDKKLSMKETYHAINEVMSGNQYCDHSILNMLEIGSFMNITERQKELLNHLRAGLTQKEIASKMFVVPKTVEATIKNLFEKFEVKNSVELIAKYMKYKNANRENYDDTTPPFKEE